MSFTGQWKRFGCCPLDQDDIPTPPQNLLVFEVIGYNYRAIPTWFDANGERMMNVQFSVVYDQLYYRWTFYKKMGDVCNTHYYFSTSDDIVPTIFEATSGRKMKVRRMSRHNGYTTWLVSC